MFNGIFSDFYWLKTENQCQHTYKKEKISRKHYGKNFLPDRTCDKSNSRLLWQWVKIEWHKIKEILDNSPFKNILTGDIDNQA